MEFYVRADVSRSLAADRQLRYRTFANLHHRFEKVSSTFAT